MVGPDFRGLLDLSGSTMFFGGVLSRCRRVQVGDFHPFCGAAVLLEDEAGWRAQLDLREPAPAVRRRRGSGGLSTEALCVTGSPASVRGCLKVEGLREAEVVDLRPL